MECRDVWKEEVKGVEKVKKTAMQKTAFANNTNLVETRFIASIVRS